MQEEMQQAQGRRYSPAPLIAISVLAALNAVFEAVSFAYARIHLQQILRGGSVAVLGGRIQLTESAAQANPHLVVAVFCVLLAAAGAAGARYLRRKNSGAKN